MEKASNSSPLQRAIDIMDRLYGPGGCPWTRSQTHTSLVPYLLEESHELAEAIESGDNAHMREELGDVLFQVLFHARIAAESSPEPFNIQDVANDLADKLVRRNPHVFASNVNKSSIEQASRNWEAIKRAEKARSSVLEGIPVAQDSIARAQKIISRADQAGFLDQPNADQPHEHSSTRPQPSLDNLNEQYGAELLNLVRRAGGDGVDAATALRGACRALEAQISEMEQAEVSA